MHHGLMLAANVVSAFNGATISPLGRERHNAHCLEWFSKRSEDFVKLVRTDDTGRFGLCRFESTSGSILLGSFHVVGSVGRSGADNAELCTVEGTTSSADFEVAAISSRCESWWHLQAFNALPLPLMAVFPLEDGAAGICRTTAYTGEQKVPVIGRLHAAGPHYAKCEIGGVGGGERPRTLSEGDFHLLGAYDRNRPYVARPRPETLRSRSDLYAELAAFVDRFVCARDRIAISRASGHPFPDLMGALECTDPVILTQVLSSDRWVFDERLNRLGLHLLRSVLAERIADARRRAKGYHKHPDYAALTRDGLVRKDFSKLTNRDVRELLQMVSGYDEVDVPDLAWFLRVVEPSNADPNLALHVDTFLPAWKVFLYAENMTHNKGPTNYVLGSHTNGDRKLRWLYHASNHPPKFGAGSYGSFRMGPAPRAHDPGSVEETWGFVNRTALVGGTLTLLVIDVSGLHSRGIAVPGTLRRTLILSGAHFGGLPRLNPFAPPRNPGSTAIQNLQGACGAAGDGVGGEKARVHATSDDDDEVDAKESDDKTNDAVPRLPPQHIDIETHTLYVPKLLDLADMIEGALVPHFESVEVSVVPCPDLTTNKWGLAAPGISGSNAILNIGGEHHQLTPHAQSVTFELADIASRAALKGAYFIGAGAAPRSSVGCNGELIPIDAMNSGVRRSKLAVVHSRVRAYEETPAQSAAASSAKDFGISVLNYNSSEVGFLANVMASRGAPGPVVRVRAAVRRGPACASLPECIQTGINAERERLGLGPIGIGGVFRVVQGLVDAHVMADADGRAFSDPSEVQPFLKHFHAGPGLVCLTVFLAGAPRSRGPVRMEHTHFFRPKGAGNAVGGHYHGDVSPSIIEYVAYLVPNAELYIVDKN